MALNAEWHEQHPMPAGATFEQRLEWHREHARACARRKPPADIADELARRERESGEPAGA